MLATTIQITNNPPHTTHTQGQNPQAGCAGTHHQQAVDAHTVLNVNPTVCSSITTFMPNPKTHPHPPPHTQGSKHMRAQENNPTQPNRPCRTVPHKTGLPRKEVIQPHLPVRLPCYDFTPLTLHTFDASAPRGVRPAASGADDSGGVTGGVYKARERIHRGMLIRDY